MQYINNCTTIVQQFPIALAVGGLYQENGQTNQIPFLYLTRQSTSISLLPFANNMHTPISPLQVPTKCLSLRPHSESEMKAYLGNIVFVAEHSTAHSAHFTQQNCI